MSKRIPVDEIVRRLRDDGRGIRLVGGYEGTDKKAEFECRNGHRFRSAYSSLKNKKYGCPHCWQDARSAITKEAVNQPGVKERQRISLLRANARPDVRARRKSVMKEINSRLDVKKKHRADGGWANAKRFRELGYNRIALYKIEFIYKHHRIKKPGISHDPKARWKEISIKLRTLGASDIQLLTDFEWGTPEEICKREREIKKASMKYLAHMPRDFKGWSECFTQIVDPKNAEVHQYSEINPCWACGTWTPPPL